MRRRTAVRLGGIALCLVVSSAAVAAPSTLSVLQTTPSLPALKLKGSPKRGRNIFLNVAHCGVCHTLKDAHATATLAPNLDLKKPSFALVVRYVTLGAGHGLGDCNGVPRKRCEMPAFSRTVNPYGEYVLSNQQIADVAAYVSTAAGR